MTTELVAFDRLAKFEQISKMQQKKQKSAFGLKPVPNNIVTVCSVNTVFHVGCARVESVLARTLQIPSSPNVGVRYVS